MGRKVMESIIFREVSVVTDTLHNQAVYTRKVTQDEVEGGRFHIKRPNLAALLLPTREGIITAHGYT